jgi:hypothetical protein
MIKPITANTRIKDKYVQVGMINSYLSWLGGLIILVADIEGGT